MNQNQIFITSECEQSNDDNDVHFDCDKNNDKKLFYESQKQEYFKIDKKIKKT